MRQLHADRGRQAVAHGAEPAGRHPAVRLLEIVELRRPHLVLADFGGDVGVAVLGQLVEPLDGVLRLDDVARLPVGERLARPPLVDLRPPHLQRLLVGVARLGAPQPHHVFQHMRAVADDRHVDMDVLVDRRRIDIDVDLLRAGREGVDAAGDAVVEARADADHHVAIVHRHVGFQRAVHAEHAHPFRIGGGERAEAHQRRGDREAGELDQFAQQVARRLAGIDDAAAGVEQRPLGVRHQLDRLLDLVEVAFDLRLVAGVREILRLRIDALGELDVLRDIDDDRPGPPGLRRCGTPRAARAADPRCASPDNCTWCTAA